MRSLTDVAVLAEDPHVDADILANLCFTSIVCFTCGAWFYYISTKYSFAGIVASTLEVLRWYGILIFLYLYSASNIDMA